MRYIVAAALIATPAFADYQEHPGVTLFTEKPCIEAVAVIDAPGYDANTLSDIEPMTTMIAQKAMAWGFILGYDTANGGMSGDHETTLQRLRAACAHSPETTAFELLESFR